MLFFVVIILSDEPGQKQGRGLVDRKLVKAPQYFIGGRPVAALLWQAKCTIIRETKVHKAKTMVLTINLG